MLHSSDTNLPYVVSVSQNFVYYPRSGLFGHELLQLALCELARRTTCPHVPPRVGRPSVSYYWDHTTTLQLQHTLVPGMMLLLLLCECGTNGTIMFDCWCRPINCDITVRAFGICREISPGISQRHWLALYQPSTTEDPCPDGSCCCCFCFLTTTCNIIIIIIGCGTQELWLLRFIFAYFSNQ